MYKIVTDGSCDLGKELAQKLNVEVVPFYVSVDDITYQKEIEEIAVRDFYEFMRNNPKVFPKSSLPSVEDYMEVFTNYAKEGTDVICICITTKFSGSYNAAQNAKQIVLEEYPRAKITVIDSKINTVLQGTMVMELAKGQQSGATYDQLLLQIEKIKGTGRIFFTVDNVEYLAKGGRIGRLAQFATSTLKIKPLIILKEGEIFSGGISRGREKAKKKIIEQTVKYIEENEKNPDAYAMTVGFGYDAEEGKAFQKLLLESLYKKWPEAHPEVSLLQIGATIGVHTGPYPLGVAIIKKVCL